MLSVTCHGEIKPNPKQLLVDKSKAIFLHIIMKRKNNTRSSISR
jgi:hypothetical protein